MDNFDLKKFLKESKALENLNPILKKENLTEENIRSKIREMILAELDPGEEESDRMDAGAEGGFLEESYPEDEEDNYDYSNDYYDDYSNGDPNDFGDTDEFDGYGGYDIDEAKKKDKEADVEDVETTDTETTDTTEELPAEEAPAEEIPAGGGLEDVAADMEGTEGELMDYLMKAFKIAKGMNNEKLETQVGNTLKFFVSEYIGGGE